MPVIKPIEEAPPKWCRPIGDYMVCNWVQKGQFALMADDGGNIIFPLKKTKVSEKETNVEEKETA